MLFLLLFFIVGCMDSSKSKDSSVLVNSNLIYRVVNDSEELYSYPKSKLYKKGDFKVKSLEIRERDQEYICIIEIANNFRSSLNRWDSQVFDLYLFTNEGNHIESLYGRQVKFSEKWEKMILISPQSFDELKRELYSSHSNVSDDISPSENLSKSIYLPKKRYTLNNRLYVHLPRRSFKHIMENLKGIQLLVSAIDRNSKSKMKILEVKSFATRYHFGGGSYSGYQPNVVSILGSQELTYSKVKTRKIFATIDKVDLDIDEK